MESCEGATAERDAAAAGREIAAAERDAALDKLGGSQHSAKRKQQDLTQEISVLQDQVGGTRKNTTESKSAYLSRTPIIVCKRGGGGYRRG